MLSLAVVLCSILYVVDGQPQPPILPELPSVTCPGGRCPPQSGLFCFSEGKIYLSGQQFTKDGCNTCTCSNGKIACTEKACLCPNGNSPLPNVKCDGLSICPDGYICDTSNNPLDTPNQIGICCKDQAPKCKPGFIEHPSAVCGGIAGMLCPEGYECDMSHVPKGTADGIGSCCKVDCKAVPCPRIVGCMPENIVTPPGQCCPICREPKCKDGNKPLPGIKCDGFPGIIRCPAGYICDKSNNDPKLPDLPGICCKPTFCLDGKRKIPHGESFMNDCNTCQCDDGRIICTLIACPPKCRPGYIPHPTDKCGGIAGMLCPESYECDMSHVPEGTTDVFGSCCKIDCKAVSVSCPRIVGCAPEYIFTPPGQCCPICKEPKCKDGNKPLPGIKCEGFPGIIKGSPAIVRCPAGYVCDKSNNNPKLPDLPGICCKAVFCEVNGKKIENGVSFPVDCNTCQCVDGQVICTLIACEPKCKNGNNPLRGIRCEGVPGISRCPAGSFCDKSNNSPDSPELPGICCKPTCIDGKITRKDGEVFLRDCNTCRCSDGKILCTQKNCPDCSAVLCVEPPKTCLNPFTPPGKCCPRCIDCSAVLCALPVGCSREDFFTPPGECCPQCKGTCEVDGKRIANGVSFPVDCNTCQCVDGQIFCTLIACVDPAPKCKPGFIAHPKAKCGGIAGLACPKGYICDTSNVPDGTADAFGICCKADCRLVRCGRPVGCPEKDIYTPIGQCCPVCLPPKCENGRKQLSGVKCGGSTGLKCQRRYFCDTSLILKGSADFGVCCKGRSCMEKGKKIRHGKSFKRDCNTCRCNDGKAACTRKACPGKPGQTCLYKGEVYTEGQTTGDYCHTCTCTNGVMHCPNKASCVNKRPCTTADGTVLKHGEEYREYCNTCTCNDGKIGCTKKLCAKRSCTYNGQEYKHGETFGDYCHTCTCTDGEVACPQKSQCVKKRPCTTADGTVLKHGEEYREYCNTCMCNDGKIGCTKKLCAKRSCTYNGQEYKHGETFGDYCHTCTCTDGEVVCPKKSQCATNKPCTYKGHTYKHSQTFLDVCNTCRCSDGKVGCTEKICKVCPPTCPQLRCANQVTLKGACCPTCVTGGY